MGYNMTLQDTKLCKWGTKQMGLEIRVTYYQGSSHCQPSHLQQCCPIEAQ